MARAVVLLNTEAGLDTEAAGALKEVDGVSDVYLVSGLYDVVATVTGASAEDILHTVYNRVRIIEGVEATHTMFCLEP
ncbi:Lrp/AsnC family transcriptional regulator [Nitrospinae bacterium AH_259_B05_G02_I21]|nr:Lrp/AsnC family transcriptional regulator [Nitrospinae bacterium AH_259_B05_G02_I21]MDA2932611.1 Lrp/AsnC family transcriptional regulator [Nitrospinae bacterium AH-259-F20]